MLGFVQIAPSALFIATSSFQTRIGKIYTKFVCMLESQGDDRIECRT